MGPVEPWCGVTVAAPSHGFEIAGTDPAKRARGGISAFLVPRGTPGFEVTRIDTTIRNTTLPEDPLAQREDRGDLGFNFKLAPDNQFWFKAGVGQQQNLVTGGLVSQASADALTAASSTELIHSASTRVTATPSPELVRSATSLPPAEVSSIDACCLRSADQYAAALRRRASRM